MFIETDFGFRHKLPAISGAIQLVNKHGLTPFWLLQTVTKVFDARRIFFAYFLGSANERKILPSTV